MKPPYRVMSMREIRELEPNGFTVASTFSGCGGSSTGYRMAGFRVLWASEFVDAARESYKANAAPYTVVDGRDVRAVDADEVLAAMGLKAGELDLLDGSPPCASFSTAGKREAGWGKVKAYSDKAQRTDDLFFEYTRLLRGIQPRTFVAENVSGLVKGTAKGYFLEILAELKSCGYRVDAKLLDAQWLGVPQARQRLIFVGVRNDIGLAPVFPKPLPYRYSVRDALPHVLRQGDNGPFGKGELRDASVPSPTIGASINTGNGRFPPSRLEVSAVRPANIMHPTECRYPTIPELKRICAFPDDFVLTGTFAQQWERCGRAVPPVMMMHIAAAIRDNVLRKTEGSTSHER